MTQGEQRALKVRAARTCRSQYRKADSAGEKLERELDRLVKRKTLITPASLATTERLYYSYKGLVGQLENSLADFYMIVAS